FDADGIEERPSTFVSPWGLLPITLLSPFLCLKVTSPNEARAYGTGEVILIDVVYDQPVFLVGIPTLLLKTGVFKHEVQCLQ
ncbi:unnamed protein product, partial [Discosporangium mesarthrocarpum]